MTENEAIKVLEKPSKHIRMVHKTKNEMEFYTFSSDLVEAFETAIQALEEIQAYRAIGTVEGYEKAIQSSIEYYNLMKEYKAKVDELEAIGTIDDFKALKEKSVAKKPTKERNGDIIFYHCPTCNHILGNSIMRYENPYCPDCGQAIDWS